MALCNQHFRVGLEKCYDTMRKYIFLLAGFLCLLSNAQAQSGIDKNDLDSLRKYEEEMVLQADSMYQAPIVDLRGVYCEQLGRLLVKALKIKGSYTYPFEKLGEKISIIYPDDNAFRMFNWSMLNTEVTLRYYGAIQMNSDELKLYPLFDHSDNLGKGAEDSVFTNGRWFGALYYRIMAHETEYGTMYTLFGQNKSSIISTKKVMDPMVLSEQGPVFGFPVFRVRNERGTYVMQHRFIIEYKKEVQASLNWDDKMKAVYFDRLISQVNDPNRKYTYVPSGQYDGFRWKDGRWDMVEDLIPIQEMKDGEAPAPQPRKKKRGE